MSSLLNKPMCLGGGQSTTTGISRTWSVRTIHKVKKHVSKNNSMRTTSTNRFYDNEFQFTTATLSTKIIPDIALEFSTKRKSTTNEKDEKKVNVAQSRWDEQHQLFDDLFTEVQDDDANGSESIGLEKFILRKSSSSSSAPTALKTIKSVFTSTAKFQNNLKGGIYLSALIHHGGKVLVTGQGMIPIIEIDSDYSKTELPANMQWMTKVSSMWQNAKVLKSELSGSSDTSASKLFRLKFLSAVTSFQRILGLHELGQLHYQPIKDAGTGSMIIVAVQTLKDANRVSTVHAKWTRLEKLENALRIGQSEKVASTDVLIHSARDMISFQQSSSLRLPKGLYLGYLKLSSSLDGINIRTDRHQTNVLPNVKVRTDNKVSREELEWLKCLKNADVDRAQVTSLQTQFYQEIMTACDQLFVNEGVTKESTGAHRFYDLEVIDLGYDVTFIIVLPPVDDLCSGPQANVGTIQQIVPQHALPVHVFETMQQRAYQCDRLQRYNQLSCYICPRIDSAHQRIRQALSNDDVTASKNKLQFYTDKQQSLETGYQSTRWIIDVINKSRDKTAVCVGADVSKMYSVVSS